MIELTVLVWTLAAFTAYIGWKRGWIKEVIALAGITLGLFAMSEFQVLFNNTFNDLPPEQRFYLQSVLFLLIVFFAYQTRELDRGSRGATERDELQSRVLGAIVGLLNGYLISGTLWYFLTVHPSNGNYALSPYVVAPAPGTDAAAAAQNLPLQVLTAGQNGDLLALMVVVLFVVVLVLI